MAEEVRCPGAHYCLASLTSHPGQETPGHSEHQQSVTLGRDLLKPQQYNVMIGGNMIR